MDVSQLTEERPVENTDAQLKAILEAIVYVTDEPLSAQQMAAALERPIDKIKRLLDELVAEFAAPGHGLSIREVAGGYKMATKAEHHEAVRAFVKKLTPPLKLSLAALETLAVIAYKQPVTAPEIMEIRGVQGASVLKTLLDRKLIAEAGRKNVVGKPILYKTTKEFLVQFGLKDLTELPTLKEFEELGRLIGERSGTGSAERRRRRRPPRKMPEERLQKILSQAGVASRRKAEELIVEGRVTVNGKTVTELGSKADIENDHIKVDGRLLRAPKHLTYIALNKPKECMTTVSDPEGRQTVMHLMRGVRERVFPVGRLDYHSEGLLLLTNDGEFAHRLTAPANHVTKTYVVKVNGALTEEQEKQFREGIPLHGRKTSPAELKRIKQGANPWYEVKITEGRQNQIRIMFKHFGRLVEKLRRVKIGFLELDVAPGRYRSLTPKEVEQFRKLLKLDKTSD